MANRVFLDANVLVEIAEERVRQSQAHRALNKYAGDTCISTLTGSFVMYFALKRSKDLSMWRSFLADHELLSLQPTDFDWAFTSLRDDDFEDALQLAVAIRNGCDRFVTFDKELYKNYKNLSIIKIELLH